jgi:hypothetical protein
MLRSLVKFNNEKLCQEFFDSLRKDRPILLLMIAVENYELLRTAKSDFTV